MNTIYKTAIRQVYSKGDVQFPRGLECRALFNYSFSMSPHDRIVSLGKRNNIKYGVAELMWYLTGDNKLKDISPYCPSMKYYSDDGVTVNSGYGLRLMPQLYKIISLLKMDRHSRQAMASIRSHSDIFLNTKDQICTSSLHFQIGRNGLNLTSHMRSQDLFKGFIYDHFCFSYLQELVANSLSIPCDRYVAYINNLHYYKKDEEKILSLLTIDESDFKMKGVMNLILTEKMKRAIKVELGELYLDSDRPSSHLIKLLETMDPYDKEWQDAPNTQESKGNESLE